MSAQRAVELVLFDFGGTLFHPAPTEQLLAGALGGLGFEVPADELAGLARAYDAAGIPGGPVPPIPPELRSAYDARDLSIDEHRLAWVGMLVRAELPVGAGVPDARALAEAIYEQTLEPAQWVPYADAAATLAGLAERGIRVGVISNIGFDLREILHTHGFGALTDTLTQSYEVGVMKPDARIFQAALDRFGVQPEMALMVGDSEEADGGAAAVGMTVLILPMTPPGSVHELGRVIELVDRLNAG
jgi:HAD superfamily hydrolase (TIGR01549 family)